MSTRSLGVLVTSADTGDVRVEVPDDTYLYLKQTDDVVALDYAHARELAEAILNLLDSLES